MHRLSDTGYPSPKEAGRGQGNLILLRVAIATSAALTTSNRLSEQPQILGIFKGKYNNCLHSII